MSMTVLETVLADVVLLVARGHIIGEYLEWVAIVTALALDGLGFGHVRLQPVGNGPRQDAPSLTERALGMETPEDGFADEGRFIGQVVEDLGQMVIDAERYDCLLLLSHQIYRSGWKINAWNIIV